MTNRKYNLWKGLAGALSCSLMIQTTSAALAPDPLDYAYEESAAETAAENDHAEHGILNEVDVQADDSLQILYDHESSTDPETDVSIPDTWVTSESVPESDTEFHTDSNTDFNTDSGIESDSERDTESNPESNIESNTESNTESNIESNEEPDTEPDTETEEETGSEMESETVLSVVKGDVEIFLRRYDGEAFEEGTVLHVDDPEEMIASSQEWLHADQLQEYLFEQLPEEKKETALLRYYYHIWLETDEKIALTDEDFVLEFQIRGEEVLDQLNDNRITFDVVQYDQNLKLLSDSLDRTSVWYDNTEELVHVSPEVRCGSVYGIVDMPLSDNAEWNAEMIASSVFEQRAVDASFPVSGTLITNAGSYKIVSLGKETFSDEYQPLRGVPGVSEFSTWCNSSSVLRGTSSSGHIQYFIPSGDSDKGKFGFKITNVAYNREENCYVDMMLTVTDYKNYAVDIDGTVVQGIYPAIGMIGNGAIEIKLLNELPDFELKCDLYKSGSNQKIKGNYRLCWTDIDAFQRFGIVPADGAVAQKYALDTGTTYVQKYNVFGKNYDLLAAPWGGADADDLSHSSIFELKDVSSFYVYVGQPGNNERGYKLKREIEAASADALDGIRDSFGLLNWENWTYGPTSFAAPAKYVSNDAKSWGASNRLDRINDAYYYQFEQYIPYEYTDYYYAEYQLEDILPKGISWAETFQVEKKETKEDVTGQFEIQVPEDSKNTVAIRAKKETLSDAEFYGYTYHFLIKVKTSPELLADHFSEKTGQYAWDNQVALKARHKTESQPTVKQSDPVTTQAVKTYVSITATKEIMAEDIVWEHGDPYFTFCVTGKDLEGRQHTYYKTVHFIKGNQNQTGAVSLNTVFQVPSGTYALSELSSLRYRLREIKNVKNGTVKENKVEFDLTRTDTGSAVFLNDKQSDWGTSHTDYVRNIIIPEV